MANLSAIKLPNGTTYNLKDNGALQLTGGSVTGPVSFGDSVSIDEATVGDLVVNGSASFTNNLQANTINGVAVGSSPKFTDTTYSSLAAASGGTAVSLVTTGEKYRWNSKTSNTGTITSVKTTAGAHTTVNVTSGAVSFNVPTTAAHVGAVPTTRKVNNKALSSDITLTAPDVGAAEVQKLTQAEYDALTTVSDDTIYFITDGSASTRNPYLDMNYPIGSYYETSDANFDPNTVWGGTWTQVSGAALSTDAAEVIANIVSFNIGRARSSHVSVTAPNVTGYTFVCWGEVATNGWIGGVYPADPTSQTSNFWVAVSDGQTASANVRAVAIYRKDKTPVNRWHRTA